MTARVVDDASRVRAQLAARYKPLPKMIDTALALDVLGVRDVIHPRDAVAFLYHSYGQAAAYILANEEYFNCPSFGPLTIGGGIVVALDLRRQLAAHDIAPTDPTLPDNEPRSRP